MAAGRVMVTHRVEGHGWRPTVSDNGVGKPNGHRNLAVTGLAAGIVAALVGQHPERRMRNEGRDQRKIAIMSA
jgi:hypothetical protein